MRLGRLLIRAVEANERLILLHKEGRTIGKAQENVWNRSNGRCELKKLTRNWGLRLMSDKGQDAQAFMSMFRSDQQVLPEAKEATESLPSFTCPVTMQSVGFWNALVGYPSAKESGTSDDFSFENRKGARDSWFRRRRNVGSLHTWRRSFTPLQIETQWKSPNRERCGFADFPSFPLSWVQPARTC